MPPRDDTAASSQRKQFQFLPITEGVPEADGLLERWLYEVTLVTTEWSDTHEPITATAQRGFRDFKLLALLLHHENTGLILPPLPDLDCVGAPVKVMTNIRPEPIVIMWRMKGLSLFLEHLAGCPTVWNSIVLRQFMFCDAAGWQQFCIESKSKVKKAKGGALALRWPNGETPQLHSPSVVEAEQWAKSLMPHIAQLKERLAQLQHTCLTRSHKPPPSVADFEALTEIGSDQTTAAILGISALVFRAQQTIAPQLDQWLVLLMVDVAFYSGLAHSILDTCHDLKRLEKYKYQQMASKKLGESDIDMLQNKMDRALELFAAEYSRCKQRKKALCMRICHTFAKLSIHLMGSEVDWMHGEADKWLALLPDYG